jgi:hypothetical protein
MTVLVDTSIWVEFFRGNQPWFDRAGELLDRNQIIAISPIFGELLQGVKNVAERVSILEFWNSLPKPDETGIFIRAGTESARSRWSDKGIGLIDAAIAIAARETGSFVWTLDKKLLRILTKEEIYQ